MRRVPGAATVVSLTVTVLAFGLFLYVMAYPWQLAVLASTAIGALAYSAQTTWTRMRRLHRPPDSSDLAIGRTSTRGDISSSKGDAPTARGEG